MVMKTLVTNPSRLIYPTYGLRRRTGILIKCSNGNLRFLKSDLPLKNAFVSREIGISQFDDVIGLLESDKINVLINNESAEHDFMFYLIDVDKPLTFEQKLQFLNIAIQNSRSNYVRMEEVFFITDSDALHRLLNL